MYFALCSLQRISSMLSNGYASAFDSTLTFRKSTQKEYYPFAFRTITTGLDQVLSEASLSSTRIYQEEETKATCGREEHPRDRLDCRAPEHFTASVSSKRMLNPFDNFLDGASWDRLMSKVISAQKMICFQNHMFELSDYL
ncbi:hypothetical protein TSAR_006927 [Trichomalopsis sarcophagae]|uniref:Uncharacterized protein n=1 Tax=Trichomalopsis sarcophagae TaxID=543379 RepID=A0A232ET96_9HYME|nr:hypothetical protein TSAR_006927 [Trichomalopsis sarcophagae]